MNFASICFCAVVTGSLCLATFTHMRRREETRLAKEANFEDIKNTVTKDVLSETIQQLSKSQDKLEKMKTDLVALKGVFESKNKEEEKMKLDVDECQGDEKHIADALADLEAQIVNGRNEFEKQKEDWKNVLASVNQEASQKSKVCEYIIKTDPEGMKLCGIKPVVPAVAAVAAEAAKLEKAEPQVKESKVMNPEGPKGR